MRAESALIKHPTLKRWLRTSKNGRPAIDRAKIKMEERLDGKYLLTSSDPHLTAEEIAVGYKALLEAERGFRDLRTVLELRPVFHRLEHRIHAHVLLCWLALRHQAATPNHCRRPCLTSRNASTWTHASAAALSTFPQINPCFDASACPPTAELGQHSGDH
ncbi:hypothetical protein [Salinispora sp. H7-4]|uniref:hypothetical protein n=1 Tax=Salinispora sp. H7-4 TaxID=2748321 RepID=UPI0015D14725|nr:hypothetical protein [Salinispora sp. H7-4]NYT94809.1 hypothetical protein [Salinispora sp. H7-4]